MVVLPHIINCAKGFIRPFLQSMTGIVKEKSLFWRSFFHGAKVSVPNCQSFPFPGTCASTTFLVLIVGITGIGFGGCFG